MTTTDRRGRPAAAHVDLPITGMTCASCAARIERGLNRLDGVEAAVTLWCAWPFHRAALVHLRHGATTMDTLVSVGV